jgi:hypothetical protein
MTKNSWPETPGEADGELEGLVDGSDEGLEEGALLKLGMLEDEDDDEGWPETPGDTDEELEAGQRAQTRDSKKAHCSNWACWKATKRAVPRHWATQMASSKAWQRALTTDSKKAK